jgi:hypothetical protein
VNWKQDPRNLVRSIRVTNNGVSFANVKAVEDEDTADMTITTAGSSDKKRGAKDKSKVTCRQHGKKGHYTSECDNERLIHPLSTTGDAADSASTASSITSAGSSSTTAAATCQSGATMLLSGIAEGEFDKDLTVDFQFLTQHTTKILLQLSLSSTVPKHWILLDNRLTVDVFQNKSLLRNI